MEQPRARIKLSPKPKKNARIKRRFGGWGVLPSLKRSSRLDYTVLLEHEAEKNRWHVGVSRKGRHTEYFPISKHDDPAIVEAIERITKMTSEVMTREPEEKSLLQKFKALLDQGEASHKRARDAIVRFDAAAARAKASLQATRELLDGPAQ